MTKPKKVVKPAPTMQVARARTVPEGCGAMGVANHMMRS